MRSRTRGTVTDSGPMPVTIEPVGRWPFPHQRTAPKSIALPCKATQEISALGVHRGLQQFHSFLSEQFSQRIALRTLTSNRNNPIVLHGGGEFLY